MTKNYKEIGRNAVDTFHLVEQNGKFLTCSGWMTLKEIGEIIEGIYLFQYDSNSDDDSGLF